MSLMLPKRPRIDNPKHLARVRQMPCFKCRKTGPNVAHHLRISREGGTSMKPGDNLVVSLCPEHHDELHKHKDGELEWWFEIVKMDKESLREILCGHARALFAETGRSA